MIKNIDTLRDVFGFSLSFCTTVQLRTLKHVLGRFFRVVFVCLSKVQPNKISCCVEMEIRVSSLHNPYTLFDRSNVSLNIRHEVWF